MGVSYKCFVAGAALVLAGTASASAADLYAGPGMKDAPVVYSERAGWYLRGDYSYVWSDAGELARPIAPAHELRVGLRWDIR